jgi:hypothetical protein
LQQKPSTQKPVWQVSPPTHGVPSASSCELEELPDAALDSVEDAPPSLLVDEASLGADDDEPGSTDDVDVLSVEAVVLAADSLGVSPVDEGSPAVDSVAEDSVAVDAEGSLELSDGLDEVDAVVLVVEAELMEVPDRVELVPVDEVPIPVVEDVDVETVVEEALDAELELAPVDPVDEGLADEVVRSVEPVERPVVDDDVALRVALPE